MIRLFGGSKMGTASKPDAVGVESKLAEILK